MPYQMERRTYCRNDVHSIQCNLCHDKFCIGVGHRLAQSKHEAITGNQWCILCHAMPTVLNSEIQNDWDLCMNMWTGVTNYIYCTITTICQGSIWINGIGSTAKEMISLFNSLRPKRDRRYFADDIFKCIFLNGNVWISINISMKVVPKGPFNNIPALIQIMAWRRSGDKPLSEPMMASLQTHVCVTRPQWVNVGETRLISRH